MKVNFLLQLACLSFFMLQILRAQAAPPMDMDAVTADDFSAQGNAVLDLLKTRDVGHFVAEMAPSAQDFRPLLNSNGAQGDQAPAYVNAAKRNLKESAEALLQTADSLHLNFADSNFVANVIPPKHGGSIQFSGDPRDSSQGTPYIEKLEIVLTSKANANGAGLADNDFKIAMRQLIKFSSGWKPDGGVQWAGFPASIANDKIRREMTIMQFANDYKALTAQDDPALLPLANAVVHFIQGRDAHIYEQDALANEDEMFSVFQKQQMSAANRKLKRGQFDAYWNPQQQRCMDAAHSVLQFMDDAGVDLKDAQIKVGDVSVKHIQPPMTAGSIEGLRGNQFKIQFRVQSGGKSKNGASLAGDYVLAADEIMCLGDDWKITGNLRWDKMPDGILDADARAKMQFESYVAEHNTLPPGTMAPEIEFTRLDNGEKMKLSDLRGKVVVLDFWATWCGPCQGPMAHLQTLPAQHPDWNNQVAIVPLSIDDTIQILRNHIDKRGWTNTFNVWAGDGGWESTPAKTFRVRGVPTTYIIDTQGKIVKAGHPAAMNIEDEVNGQLSLAKQ